MAFMRRSAVTVTVLAILTALVAGAVVGFARSGRDPMVKSPSNPDLTSSLFVQPEGTDARACGDYIATWLDLLHAEDAFPINELKADLGQGPLWVAVTDVWGMALDLETRVPRAEAARRLIPTIASACEEPDVRAQFVQLQSS
jgi:hypothetical protein